MMPVSKLPSFAVAECAVGPSLFQVTVSPTLIVIAAGENSKSLIVTVVEADALALRVPLSPPAAESVSLAGSSATGSGAGAASGTGAACGVGATSGAGAGSCAGAGSSAGAAGVVSAADRSAAGTVSVADRTGSSEASREPGSTRAATTR